MAQFSVKIMRPTGSVLGENQHCKFKLEVLLDLAALTDPNATETAAEPSNKDESSKEVIEFRFSI